jgi:signal transduction histidine kinase
VHPIDPNGRHPVARVMRSGKGALMNDIPDGGLASAAEDENHLDVLSSAGFVSGICVPLVARDRILGTLTLLSDTPGRRYSQDDLTLTDVLARRAALAADNARLFREAQEALAVREEFLTSISHDLRTPLTSAKGFAQLLQRRLSRTGAATAPEVLSEGFQTIDASLTRMATLVGQLLDLSRLQTGRPLDLERGPTDLVALAERAVIEHTSSSDRDQITVESDLDELVGFWDAARLERVLGNLLSNAIKYSPEGGAITLRITRRLGPEGEEAAVLTARRQHHPRQYRTPGDHCHRHPPPLGGGPHPQPLSDAERGVSLLRCGDIGVPADKRNRGLG